MIKQPGQKQIKESLFWHMAPKCLELIAERDRGSKWLVWWQGRDTEQSHFWIVNRKQKDQSESQWLNEISKPVPNSKAASLLAATNRGHSHSKHLKGTIPVYNCWLGFQTIALRFCFLSYFRQRGFVLVTFLLCPSAFSPVKWEWYEQPSHVLAVKVEWDHL